MVVLAASVAVTVVPTTEVHAWAVWAFHAIFGGDDTHTTIDPVDENDYLQCYVSEIVEGFEIISQENVSGRERIVYVNGDDKFISFEQMKKESYSGDIDQENRNGRYECIGQFEVLVTENNDSCIFTIINDVFDVAVIVHTDAGYETGRKFVERLVFE